MTTQQLEESEKCEQIAAEWAANKDAGVTVENITLGVAYDRYIESKNKTLSPATIREYKRQRERNLPTLMPLKLKDITCDMIQIAINEEASGKSPKTVRNIHGLLSAVLGVCRPDLQLNTTLPKKVRPELYIPSDEDFHFPQNTRISYPASEARMIGQ